MIEDCYDINENPLYAYYCELPDVFSTVINIANSELLDFDKAKDLIAQKLVTIQNQQPFEEAEDDSLNGIGSSPTSGVHTSSGIEGQDFIEQQVIPTRPTRYAQPSGELSEIHEEPNGILSTTNAGGASQDIEYTYESE